MSNLSVLNNNIIIMIIDYCLTARNLKDDITFKQLYDIYPKKLIIFVVELHSGNLVQVDFKTFPDASVKTFLLASMALPLLFPPIKYNDIYYIDGAISKKGQFPLPLEKGDHLGICIDTIEPFIQNELTFTMYLKKIFEILTRKLEIEETETIIIKIKTDIHSFDFLSVLDDKQYNRLVESGYNSIKKTFDLKKNT